MVPLSELAEIARTHGAPLCGAAKAEALSGNALEIGKILPGARSVVVLAAPHSRSAIESADVQMAQYDTVYAYGEAARASHAVARWLGQRGARAGGGTSLSSTPPPPDSSDIRKKRRWGRISWRSFPMPGWSTCCAPGSPRWGGPRRSVPAPCPPTP